MRKWIPATLTTLCLAAAFTQSAAPAYASSPHTVDPLTMTPALNPGFAPWTCFEAGTGITCQGQKDDSYTNEPIGLQCDGQDVYVTGEEHSRMTRWHDLDGFAVKTSLQTDIPADLLTLSPTGQGDQVVLSAHYHKHYVYPVPGELDSRVLTETGAILRLEATGQGMLFQDTGRVVFAPGHDEEIVTVMSGKHQLYDGTSDLDAAICGGLT